MAKSEETIMSKNKASASDSSKNEKLSTKTYDAELKKLHIELVKLQEWVTATGPDCVKTPCWCMLYAYFKRRCFDEAIHTG